SAPGHACSRAMSRRLHLPVRPEPSTRSASGIVDGDALIIATPPVARAGEVRPPPQPFAIGVVKARADPDSAPEIAGTPVSAPGKSPVASPELPATNAR